MGARKRREEYSEGYLKWLHSMRHKRLRPRMKLAIRLWASGSVKSQQEAAQMALIRPAELSGALTHNPEAQSLAREVEKIVGDKTVALSQVVALASRNALRRVNELVESENEHVALKASSDLLDRNPETSKTFRHQVATVQFNSEDAKDLAAALVAGARVRDQFGPAADSDFIKVEDKPHGEGQQAPRIQGEGLSSL